MCFVYQVLELFVEMKSRLYNHLVVITVLRLLLLLYYDNYIISYLHIYIDTINRDIVLIILFVLFVILNMLSDLCLPDILFVFLLESLTALFLLIIFQGLVLRYD